MPQGWVQKAVMYYFEDREVKASIEDIARYLHGPKGDPTESEKRAVRKAVSVLEQKYDLVRTWWETIEPGDRRVDRDANGKKVWLPTRRLMVCPTILYAQRDKLRYSWE